MATNITAKPKLYDDPTQPTRYQDLIINTLLRAKNEGKAQNTIKAINHRLKQLTKRCDLKNLKK